ncbi:MAG TPA: methyltransferase domain-containing protein [Trebonia sp.]|jgi:ubiquinone/menaquinone biosynthesis C-methylase UbiE|nr:methyltransferase domain-containing protein [Trebonia sp.]
MNPVVQYFDGVADTYDEVLPFFAGFAREVAGALVLPPYAQVLDLAAGRGALTRELAGRAGRMVAVDAAPRMVELLARDLPAVESHVMDAAALEFPDATFDLVVAGFVLHIMADPVAAVAEVKRVLRPGGQFAFTIPGRADGSPNPWQDPFDELFAEYRKYRLSKSGYSPNQADEEELLSEAGFTDVSWQTVEIAIPIADGETYWRFQLSHGVGATLNDLPDDKRTEFHDRLLAAVDSSGGMTMRQSATLALASRP